VDIFVTGDQNQSHPLKAYIYSATGIVWSHLAAHLLQRITGGLHFSEDAFYAWSKASVVLSWIKAHPFQWEPFFANRVAAI